MKYERVRARSAADGRVTDVLLEVLHENSLFLSGHEVRKDGTRMDRIHLIDGSAILSRVPLTMNLHYGELEPTDAGRPR